MSPRPHFLASPGVWLRVPRTSRNPVDDACALSHQPSARAWVASDVVLALALVGVIAAVVFGVL